MKATTSIILDNRRQKKDGTYPVKLRVTFNREQRYYQTPYNQTKDYFQKCIDPKARGEYKDYYLKFASIQQRAEVIISDIASGFSFDKFTRLYIQGGAINDSLAAAFDEYIFLLGDDREGTKHTYDTAKRAFIKFKPNVKVSDITVKFLTDFESWMLQREKSITTIAIYAKSLKAVINSLVADGRFKKEMFPFGLSKNRKYEIPSARNKKKALKLSEIATLFNFKASAGTQSMCKNYWIFLYLGNGLNVKDFCLLKWKNIDGDILTFIRAKSKRTKKDITPIQIILQPQMLSIIEKYSSSLKDADDYIFPHLTKDMDFAQQRYAIYLLTTLINRHMKAIAEAAGIEKNVTTYYARHSFATILKNSGAPVAMVSQALGHSSMATTQNYLAGFEEDQMRSAVAALTNFI